MSDKDPPESEDDSSTPDRAERLEKKQRELEQRERGLDDMADELDAREETLSERDRELSKRRKELSQREESLDEREARIAERESELDDRAVAIKERERELAERADELAETKATLEQYVGDSVREPVEEALTEALSGIDSSSRLGTIGSLVLGLVGVMLIVGGILNGFADQIRVVPVVFASDVANLSVTILLLFSGLAATLAAIAD